MSSLITPFRQGRPLPLLDGTAVPAATPTYPRVQDTGWRFDPPMGRPSKQGLVLCVHVFLSRRAQAVSRPVRLLSGRRGSDPIRRLPLRSTLSPGTAHTHVGAATPVRTIGPRTRGKGPARAGGSKVPCVHPPGLRRHRTAPGFVLSLGLVTNRCEYFLEKETEMQVGPSYSTPADTDSNASWNLLLLLLLLLLRCASASAISGLPSFAHFFIYYCFTIRQTSSTVVQVK